MSTISKEKKVLESPGTVTARGCIVSALSALKSLFCVRGVNYVKVVYGKNRV